MTDNKKPILLEEKTRIVITVKLFLIIMAIVVPGLTGLYVSNVNRHNEHENRIDLLETRMERIETKIDLLMSMSGIDPNSEAVKDYLYAVQHQDEAIESISKDFTIFLKDNIYNFKVLLQRKKENPPQDQ